MGFPVVRQSGQARQPGQDRQDRKAEENYVGPCLARLDGGEHQAIHILAETQPQVLEDHLRRQIAQLVIARLGPRHLLDQRA